MTRDEVIDASVAAVERASEEHGVPNGFSLVRGGHLAGFGWCPARIVIARLGL